MRELVFDSTAARRIHRANYDGLNGAIHAIGNGDIMLYGRGPEWMQVLGAPYTCPTVFSLIVPEDAPLKTVTRRREGVNSREHEFENGKMTDCASREYACIARHWEMTAPVRFEMDAQGFEIMDQSAVFPELAAAWLIYVPGAAPGYGTYPIMTPTYMHVGLRGGAEACMTGSGADITFDKTGDMLVVSSKSWADSVSMLRHALTADFSDILASADADDRAYLERCAKNRAALREHKLTAETLAAIEDTALQVRAQQHNEGGVQAGHNYHLAYVRDQYGVSRGLIAMGAFEEARKILEFYRNVFARWGKIANAQAMGVDGIFHEHENDEVEITGYLLLQGCDMLEADGDTEFFATLAPMLNWALRAQLKWLHNDMLPFNGDETYVPGGMLPRTALNHGSFEATLLLIGGGRRYMSYCRKFGLYEDWMDDAAARIDAADDRFDVNFRRGGDYITNSLKRLEGYVEPEFRHGVCLGGDAFDWCRRVDEGVYLCPRCIGKKRVEPFRSEVTLRSTLLMEPFTRAGRIDAEHIGTQTAAFLEEYRATGKLPSCPDGSRCLGYDFGLMLFAARACGLAADDLLMHMLSLRDECGAWCEYYENNAPYGTRCRPWESAINIAGAIEYLKK